MPVPENTTTVLTATPNPVGAGEAVALQATIQGLLGSWGTARFLVNADRLLRTASLPVGAGPWTVMLDVYFYSDTDLYQTIMGLGPTASSYIFVACSPTMTLYGEGGNSGISMSGPGFTFTPLTWYTVAITRGAVANGLSIYVCPSSAIDLTTVRLSGTGAQGTPYTRFEFGGFGTGDLHHLDGRVRRVCWWNRILSAAEREAQAIAPQAIDRTAALQGEYLFEAASGADTSGNGRTFTVSGTPTLRPSPQGVVSFLDGVSLINTAIPAFGIADLAVPSGFSGGATRVLTAAYDASVDGHYNDSTSIAVNLVVTGGGGAGGGRATAGWLALDPRRLRRRNFGI